MAKRSGKFYSRNEKETLSKLGLEPAPMSGAGWVVKEDGENETLMVQLKSTDASSYRFDMLDIKKLEYHAEVSHKVPVFLVQFLKQDKIYALVPIEDLSDVAEAIDSGKVPERIVFENKQDNKINTGTNRKVKASSKAREQFFKERSEKFGRR